MANRIIHQQSVDEMMRSQCAQGGLVKAIKTTNRSHQPTEFELWWSPKQNSFHSTKPTALYSSADEAVVNNGELKLSGSSLFAFKNYKPAASVILDKKHYQGILELASSISQETLTQVYECTQDIQETGYAVRPVLAIGLVDKKGVGKMALIQRTHDYIRLENAQNLSDQLLDQFSHLSIDDNLNTLSHIASNAPYIHSNVVDFSINSNGTNAQIQTKLEGDWKQPNLIKTYQSKP